MNTTNSGMVQSRETVYPGRAGQLVPPHSDGRTRLSVPTCNPKGACSAVVLGCDLPSPVIAGYAKAGCLLIIGLLWFGALVLRAADHYVRTPETCTNTTLQAPYTSWETAATNIQWAVDVATNGEAVWVSNGVYVLTNQIEVTNAIILRSTNGPAVTVINGNFVAGSATTNNRCLYVSNAAAFVSGFTISNGAVYNSYGGGVMNMGVLSNCYVCNNTVFMSSGGGDRGGGIYCYSGATVTACRVYGNIVTNFTSTATASGGGIAMAAPSAEVSYCVISNNSVGLGGAISLDGTRGGGISGGGRVVSSMVCNNNARGYAGGVWMVGMTMQSCTVTVNRSSYHAGGVLLQKGTITNCVISYNSGATYSVEYGGVWMRPITVGGGDHCYIRNTAIISNVKVGVAMEGKSLSNLQIFNCVIKDNYGYGVYELVGVTNYGIFNCEVSGNGGGGVILRGGILRNCLIAGNISGSVGGLWINCQTGLVSSCTITSNRSTSAGSGIRIESAAPKDFFISSCIIYSNGVNGTDDVFDACAPTNIGALQYSCIGTNPGFTGSGIIVANPQFKDFAGGNYRLSPYSPCINAGSNENWMTNSVDMDGQRRIRYGTVDMGAYERINAGAVFSGH